VVTYTEPPKTHGDECPKPVMDRLCGSGDLVPSPAARPESAGDAPQILATVNMPRFARWW
jgi:hypothetical protein